MKLENNGIIIVDKPVGYTSRDIVNIVSKKLQTKKVGHTGTLDPLASGVLVICVGKATKISDLLTSAKKEYIAKAVLGVNTDSLDVTGKVLKEENKDISRSEIEEVLKSFQKTYQQEVPLYSAVKVKGRKLYEYARTGTAVKLPKKEVIIYDIQLIDYQATPKVTFTFKCTVSKGTYIRSLIRDIAQALDTCGVMSELVRTKQGKFTIQEAISLEDIKQGNFKILNLADVLDIPQKKATGNLVKKIINGQKLTDEGLVFYVDEHNKPLAIYEGGKVLKMLYEVK